LERVDVRRVRDGVKHLALNRIRLLLLPESARPRAGRETHEGAPRQQQMRSFSQEIFNEAGETQECESKDLRRLNKCDAPLAALFCVATGACFASLQKHGDATMHGRKATSKHHN
jgi:hypothetical protein